MLARIADDAARDAAPKGLGLAAAGCRALAFRWRQDAQQTTDPILKSNALKAAEHATRLAEHFERERASPPGESSK